MQFIPIVERATAETLEIANQGWSERLSQKRLLYTRTGNLVTERSVGSEQYGRFLVDIFEAWVRRDVGRVYVQLFDVTLEAYFGRHLLCIHAPTCGHAPALEHNGDLYSCDHFVEPRFRLGNIHQTHMQKLVSSTEQRKFGGDKRDTLTAQCRQCKVRPLCNGGCPKDRFAVSRDGEPGQNHLRPGLELFFTHTRPAMRSMAKLFQNGQPPSDLMALVAAEDARHGPYRSCPCGSGRKFRFCHGDRASSSPFSGLGATKRPARCGTSHRADLAESRRGSSDVSLSDLANSAMQQIDRDQLRFERGTLLHLELARIGNPATIRPLGRHRQRRDALHGGADDVHRRASVFPADQGGQRIGTGGRMRARAPTLITASAWFRASG